MNTRKSLDTVFLIVFFLSSLGTAPRCGGLLEREEGAGDDHHRGDQEGHQGWHRVRVQL